MAGFNRATESDMPMQDAIERLRFINTVMKITRRRSPVDGALEVDGEGKYRAAARGR